MEFLTHLWLPILVSTILVFVASAILWMALPLHKKDYTAPPSEEGIVGALKAQTFAPGMYSFPWCTGGHKGMKDPDFQARFRAGPWALLIIPSSPPNFPRSLGLWFLNNLVLTTLIAYAAHAALGDSAAPAAVQGALGGAGDHAYLRVFRVVGSIALVAHAGMAAHDSIWKGLSFRHSFVKCLDGLIYALLTAGVFGWLWR